MMTQMPINICAHWLVTTWRNICFGRFVRTRPRLIDQSALVTSLGHCDETTQGWFSCTCICRKCWAEWVEREMYLIGADTSRSICSKPPEEPAEQPPQQQQLLRSWLLLIRVICDCVSATKDVQFLPQGRCKAGKLIHTGWKQEKNYCIIPIYVTSGDLSWNDYHKALQLGTYNDCKTRASGLTQVTFSSKWLKSTRFLCSFTRFTTFLLVKWLESYCEGK